MTEQHPITPPPELVEQWTVSWISAKHCCMRTYIATCAAQWGADQELEACCEWLKDPCAADMPSLAKDLQYSRRPNPPSLKEQALTKLTQLVVDLDRAGMRQQASILEGTIRRAVESIDD